jgi:hypothetical protein
VDKSTERFDAICVVVEQYQKHFIERNYQAVDEHLATLSDTTPIHIWVAALRSSFAARDFLEGWYDARDRGVVSIREQGENPEVVLRGLLKWGRV